MDKAAKPPDCYFSHTMREMAKRRDRTCSYPPLLRGRETEHGPILHSSEEDIEEMRKKKQRRKKRREFP